MGKELVNSSTFDRIPARMAKEFGTIARGDEDNYAFALFPMESNLLKANRISRINNGRRAIEAIHICLLTISGYLNQKTYDLSAYITEQNEPYVDALLMSFDPTKNDTIKSITESEYDLSSLEGLHKYYRTPVMCLLRIGKSVEFWMRDRGVTGYFDFLESQIGSMVTSDDKMEFTVAL